MTESTEQWTDEELAIFKADTSGKTFLAVILDVESKAELTPFQTLCVALIQTESGSSR